jgi:hypothetical protein
MNLFGHESKPIKYSKTQYSPIASPVLLFNKYKSHPHRCIKKPAKKTPLSHSLEGKQIQSTFTRTKP